MQELIEKYNIKKLFYKRYFEENAKQRLRMEMLAFLLFKNGRFINPMKKEEFLKTYAKEEIENFYEKKELNIPQIEFCITTKCTLKCKDCCALIPKFNKYKHINMSFEEYKLYLDRILENVNSIRHFVLLGGETLINQDLAKMIEYTCNLEKINIVELITNGTMKFPNDLITELKRNNKKVYVYISNYSVNSELQSILKHQQQIIDTLKENNIKYQMAENREWVREMGFADTPSDKITTEERMHFKCFRTQCNQVLNGYIDICSKAATARELNLLDIKDSVDIVNSSDLKEDLINFYQNDYIDACKYCILSSEKIMPAIQEKEEI